MTECYINDGWRQSFGFKHNPKGKSYIGKFDLFESNDKFEIWSLGIVKRYRNKGYGTQMLTEFISQFKSDKPLILYVYKTNEIAIRLYEKVGFVIVDECSFAPYAYTMQFKGKETTQ